MKPIRKSDGYSKEGVKKYKRYFYIEKICWNNYNYKKELIIIIKYYNNEYFQTIRFSIFI